MKRELTVDFAVVGGGSAGLSFAAGAAQLGQSVVLFEQADMGGDCLNTGCVPSKALIAAAAAAKAVREAGRFGVNAAQPEIDFAAVMNHVHGAIAAIAPHDSQARFEGLGVQVVREHAVFTDGRTLESDSTRVRFRRAVLATGSRPTAPPIDGLKDTPFHTHETVFGLQERPGRLVILGGGPIGCELGQSFARLGSQVVIVEAATLLGREDPELSAAVIDGLRADGVELHTGAGVVRVEPTPGGVALHLLGGGRIEGTHLLVAAGRAPNVEELGLEAAGIAYDKRGITVDHRLRTSNRAVYAAGDVTGRPAFTHAAGAHASLLIKTLLFAQRVNVEKLVIPRVTYTHPAVAAVGLTEPQARETHGDGVKAVTVPFDKNDRAITEGETTGFAKLVTDGKGRVLGVGMVGEGVDELLAPWVLALAHGVKLRAMAGWVPPYPTRGDVNRALASAYYSPVLFSPRTRRLVSLLRLFG
ncbi:MAG: FAD-dependent oxidoreductase [Proteobacteria bacterium]|nr:FAD-dependent oxidoreductase [Pseudomonadota bacterium]